jgi:hypothetical protein
MRCQTEIGLTDNADNGTVGCMTSTTSIPSAAEVRAALSPLSRQQLVRLAAMSGVPFTTIQKIARGDTSDPRLDTVRGLLPHIQAAGAPAIEPAKV